MQAGPKEIKLERVHGRTIDHVLALCAASTPAAFSIRRQHCDDGRLEQAQPVFGVGFVGVTICVYSLTSLPASPIYL